MAATELQKKKFGKIEKVKMEIETREEKVLEICEEAWGAVCGVPEGEGFGHWAYGIMKSGLDYSLEELVEELERY